MPIRGWPSSAGHEVDGIAGGPFDDRDQGGQLRHVASIGGDAVLAGEVGADPGQPERGELPQPAHDPEQVAGEDALAEVAELDHEDDTVDLTLADGGRREQAEHGHLGVHADVGVGHDPVDLAGHG